MATITPRFSPVRNNPFAITSTGITLIGVAIAAIGILAFFGVIPGIGSIAALCVIAGGGPLAVIGMLSGFILTNTRLFGTTQDTHRLSNNVKIQLPLTPKYTYQFLENIEANFRALSITTTYAWVEIPVKFNQKNWIFYCKYTPGNKVPFVWYQMNIHKNLCFKLQKKEESFSWTPSNFKDKIRLKEQHEIFRRESIWIDAYQISLQKFNISSSILKSSSYEKIEEFSGKICLSDYLKEPYQVRDFKDACISMDIIDLCFEESEDYGYHVMSYTSLSGSTNFIIGIQTDSSDALWYEYVESTIVLLQHKRTVPFTIRKDDNICRIPMPNQDPEAFFINQLAGHRLIHIS